MTTNVGTEPVRKASRATVMKTGTAKEGELPDRKAAILGPGAHPSWWNSTVGCMPSSIDPFHSCSSSLSFTPYDADIDHPIHCPRPSSRPVATAKALLFSISNKLSKSVSIPSHATRPKPAEPDSSCLTCRTRLVVILCQIASHPLASANNTLPSPGSSNTPTRTESNRRHKF